MSKFSLSQNKKIAISAIAIFFISFSLMLFILDNGLKHEENGYANVLSAEEKNTENHEEIEETTNIEEKYREIIENDHNSPIFVTKSDGEITFASQNFCLLLTINCDNLVGKKYFDFVNSKDLSEVIANQTKIIQENGILIEGIGPYRMIKGEKEILVLLTAYPIKDDDDKVKEILFKVKDLTEQVEELNIDAKPKKDSWINDLYPKIKEMKDIEETRMVVDKITYKSD